MKILFYKNDMVIETMNPEDGKGLKDEVTGLYINDATVQVVLKFAAGGNVPGQSWPLTLPYVAGSDGVYRGVLDAALGVKLGDRLKAEITITASGGRDAFFREDIFVADRE